MNLPRSREALEQLWKKYRLVLLIVLAGLLLMLLPGGSGQETEEVRQER